MGTRRARGAIAAAWKRDHGRRTPQAPRLRDGICRQVGLGGPGSEGDPNRQGFDHFYGYLCQRVAHNYYPTHLWRNGQRDTLAGNGPWFSAHQRLDAPLESEAAYYERFAGTQYAPDLMLAEAETFVRDHRDEPFLLVFATPVPHLALQVPTESIEPYRTLDDGPYLGQKSYLPHPFPRAAYAGMISRMDRDIGQLLALLDELGIADRTLVMFSSDNGATYTGGVEAGFFRSEGELRGLKGSVYEGGVRVPMIARWPGHVPAGTVSDRVSAFWDVLPTLTALTGTATPTGIDGESFPPDAARRDPATARRGALLGIPRLRRDAGRADGRLEMGSPRRAGAPRRTDRAV